MLGIHRVTVYKFLARYPWLNAWVNGLARAAAIHHYGLILLRHGHFAIQGSVASADLVFKAEGGYYDRNGGSGFGDNPVGDGRIHVTHNYLVPRPDYSQLQGPVQGPVVSSTPAPAPALPTPPPSVEKKKIPVISVR